MDKAAVLGRPPLSPEDHSSRRVIFTESDAPALSTLETVAVAYRLDKNSHGRQRRSVLAVQLRVHLKSICAKTAEDELFRELAAHAISLQDEPCQ
jgi:hypothetical protein